MIDNYSATSLVAIVAAITAIRLNYATIVKCSIDSIEAKMGVQIFEAVAGFAIVSVGDGVDREEP